MGNDTSATFARQQMQIQRAWKRFVSGSPITGEFLSPHIVHSWELSQKSGINPLVPQAPPVLGKKDLATLCKQHQNLLNSALPVLDMLEVSIRNTGYIATLAISSGYVLKVVGDSSFFTKAESVFNVPGALRSIDAVGSSALSLCLIEKRPLEIVGYEHYNCAFHEWKCAAAPICDETGAAIASLAISGHITRQDRHTLALATSCAAIITTRLRESIYLGIQQRLNSMLQSVYNSLPEAVLAIGKNGTITHANRNALNLICQDGEALEQKEMNAVISQENLVQANNILRQGKPKTCEVGILTSGGKVNKTCRFVPITLADGESGGMTMTIATKSQILDIARHVGGNYAKYSFSDIKGKSPALLVQIDLAHRAAATNARVLLTGESGTGKELFAQSIHNSSNVANGPFVAISCAAIPRDLIESELFGYVGGTFTGAREKGMIGKFELANGGTLFLDEINSLPLEMQAKLLRALQQNEIVRIGDTRPTPIDTRIIAATNIDLREAIKQKEFREDLYYRLNVVEIIIPPLRERTGDIELLARFILQRLSVETRLPYPEISPEVLEVFNNYTWPGNVRELDNVCERALLLSDGGIITLAHLPGHLALYGHPAEQGTTSFSRSGAPADVSLMLKLHIMDMLQQCNGNISLAAKRLGIARSTLYRNMRKHGIDCE